MGFRNGVFVLFLAQLSIINVVRKEGRHDPRASMQSFQLAGSQFSFKDSLTVIIIGEKRKKAKKSRD